ncbi:Long-chain-fatty-acid--CoA ligase, partial [mine drainage metagenome]
MPSPDERPHDLVTLVRARARTHASKWAFQFSDRTIRYDEFDRETDRFAAGLRRAGIHRGGRVATLLFNTPDFLLLWFALAKIRAVLVPLNTGLKGEILRYELDDSRPTGLVVDRRLWPVYSEVRSRVPIPHEWWTGPEDGSEPPTEVAAWTSLAGEPTAAPPAETPDPWEPAAILYTSGTTGPPKGAIIPHEKMLTTSWEIGQRSRLDAHSVLFTALPLFHCNAQEMTTLTSM